MASPVSGPDSPSEAIRNALHYSYPVILLVAYLASFMTYSVLAAPPDASLKAAKGVAGPGGKPLPATKKRVSSAFREATSRDFSPSEKSLFHWLSSGVVLSFIANITVTTTHTVVAHYELRHSENRERGWWAGKPAAVYTGGGGVVSVLILFTLFDSAPSPTWSYALTWTVQLIMEIILLISSILLYSGPHREPSPDQSGYRPPVSGMTPWEMFELAMYLVRVLLLLALVSYWAFLSRPRQESSRNNAHDSEETVGLLSSRAKDSCLQPDYGSVHSVDSDQDPEQPRVNWKRPEKIPRRSWYEYLRGYTLFFPYLWPSKSLRLQASVIICFICVLLQRGVNVLLPIQVARIVNDFGEGENSADHNAPYFDIMLFVLVKALQGTEGAIAVARNLFWLPVVQNAFAELSTAGFEHIHSLDTAWHDSVNPAEVSSALGKGASVNDFLESITFKLGPMVIDMFIAVGYFLFQYDAYYALVLFIMVITYLYLTVRMSRCRNDQKRKTTTLSRKLEAARLDSIMLHNQVKNFNAQPREFQNFRDIIDEYQTAQYAVTWSMQALQMMQLAVFLLALMATCLIASYQVANGDIRVGKFVGLITYMGQLQAPLTGFSDFYKSMQSGLINAERILEFFKEQPTVVDLPGAETLVDCQGDLELTDVHFAYDERNPALRGTSFHCEPGTTTALVGRSGGGKSTMFKLLYRLHDLTHGSFKIDGKDVSELTIDSVQRNIGVVPQNPNLFNDTIMYNLKYAKPDATDKEVFAAAEAACIHDKIMQFHNGYQHRVGHLGGNLSGGERQRIAIACVILKGARIVLLDEATAQLDSSTEHSIQKAFDTLKQNRTLIVIAHRLPTIMGFDQILYLQDGQIAERGTHDELIAQDGLYAEQWSKHQKAAHAAKQARGWRRAAKLAVGEAHDLTASASQSEDEHVFPPTPGDVAERRGSRKTSGSVAVAREHEHESSLSDSSREDDIHKGT